MKTGTSTETTHIPPGRTIQKNRYQREKKQRLAERKKVEQRGNACLLVERRQMQGDLRVWRWMSRGGSRSKGRRFRFEAGRLPRSPDYIVVVKDCVTTEGTSERRRGGERERQERQERQERHSRSKQLVERQPQEAKKPSKNILGSGGEAGTRSASSWASSRGVPSSSSAECRQLGDSFLTSRGL